MTNASRLIFALAMAAPSTFAASVLAMDHVGVRLDVPLPFRLAMLIVAMILVGLGLGAMTVRATRAGRPYAAG
jgi:ethanolamine transporter EutH